MVSTESSLAHATRGITRRGVVILLALAIVWLGWRWFQTRATENTGHVGEPPMLAENVLAVVTLNRPIEKAVPQQIVDSFGLNGANRTFAVRPNGLVESVADDERASVIEQFSRARFWFMPQFIGTLSVQSGTTHGTFPIFKRGETIFANIPSDGEVIVSPWPSAVFGAHVSCPNDCDDLPHNLASLRESGLLFDVFSAAPSAVGLVFDAKTDVDEIESAISALVARQNPEPKIVRLPDRTAYDALVPNSNVEITTGDFNGIPIALIKSGDIVWTLLHQKDRTIVTNDGKFLSEWLSTPLLTNRVCGEKPIWFYSFYPREPWPRLVYAGRSTKKLFICVN